jgi:hypothetical protein
MDLATMDVQTEIAFRDVVNFILANRGTRAFVAWTKEQIIWKLSVSSEHNTMCYCTDLVTGAVTGVMVGEIRDQKCYVLNILSTQKGNMPKFINFIVQNWGTKCTHIATNRHGRFYKEYPMTKEMYVRFMKGTQ